MQKTYYVNQIPVESIVFTVLDESRTARSLGAYTGAEVVIVDPNGNTVAGGSATITDSSSGSVTYTFPGSTVFERPGQYGVQLKLTNGSRADYADILTVRVIEPLGGVN